MQIEIEFQPDDGPKQTLYADLPRKEVEAIEAAIADPDASDKILYITSSVKKNGPSNDWMFRASRIKIHRVP